MNKFHVQSVKIMILECHEFSPLLTGLDAFDENTISASKDHLFIFN